MSKQESRQLCGIAIILMVLHHIFAPGVLGTGVFHSAVPLDVLYGIGQAAKICVAVYAFVSGYGLSRTADTARIKSFRDYYSFIGKRILSFMIMYWIAFIIVFPLGVISGCYGEITPIRLILAVLGFSTSFAPTNWYVSEYVLMLLLFPFICGALMILRSIPKLGAIFSWMGERSKFIWLSHYQALAVILMFSRYIPYVSVLTLVTLAASVCCGSIIRYTYSLLTQIRGRK